jgi:cytochrome P450
MNPESGLRLFGPEMLANPYPFYHRLRSLDPIHREETTGGWILTRYADVVMILRHARVSSDRARVLPAGVPEEFLPLFAFRANSMLNADPPKHTRLRLLVSKAFTPAAVEALTPLIQQVVDQSLDAVQAQGHMDLIHDLAYPLPVTVICAMLGVPLEDRDRLKKWADDISATVANLAPNLRPEQYRLALESLHELRQYLHTIVAQRRAQPHDDLLSALVKAEEQGDRLSEGELYANAVLLLNAGHETTTNLIGNGTLALLQHPEQMHKLRDNPALIPSGVEELLRYDSPVQFTSRVCLEDLTLDGKQLKAGETLLLLLGAANRDPATFADPDRLDVTRTENKHVAFGLGPHFCLGAPLARLEGRIVFETLLRRLPGLHLKGTPKQRDNFNLRGLESLPVAF